MPFIKCFFVLVKEGSVLQETRQDLVVSKYRLRQAEGIRLVREGRDHALQLLGLCSRPFVLCGLPLRRPPAWQLMHERRNGRFTLQVAGHPEIADSPLRWWQRGARLPRDHPGGREYRRMVAAFERVLGATIFFSSDDGRGGRLVIRAGFHFTSSIQIWARRVGGERDCAERRVLS